MSMIYQRKNKLPAHVFRAYDIRGRIGPDLNADDYYTLGLALGSLMIEKKHHEVVVGYDGRLTSESLAQAMMIGLKSCGLNVVSIGYAPSPVLYFATVELGLGAGVMITGSHNGKEYNGLKPVVCGKNLTTDDIQALQSRIEHEVFHFGDGVITNQDIIARYIDKISQDVQIERSLRIGIDCGNGVAGLFVSQLFKRLGFEVYELYCDVDGTFPNHHPDPAVDDNLADLQSLVLEKKLDLGIAFDGDADRLGVVDSDANIIRSDRVLMLLAADILAANKDCPIIFDVKCSRALGQLVSDLDGQGLMCPTGHSIVKQKMAETGALLAGEMSGHLFFKDRWNGFDDAIYAACRVLEIISKSAKTSAEVFAKHTSGYSTPELKIAVSEEEKFSLIEQIKKEIDFSPANCVYLDGVRCELPDSWALIRASNTTPCLVMRLEGESIDALEHIKQWFKDKLSPLSSKLIMPF